MKRVILRADVYGFCTGVRRAVNLALKATDDSGESGVCTLGQLVHNQQVMEMLADRGVRPIKTPEEITEGTVVIRAHGAPSGTLESFRRRGIRVVDATCPKVAKSHAIIERYDKLGYHVIVAGEREHDEVLGLVSWARSVEVIENAEEAAKVTSRGPAIVIAQTTFKPEEYERICRVLEEKLEKVQIFETVCSAMEKRREALDRLARKVDAIVIIGGRNSANTRRLYEQAKMTGLPSWYVESADELPDEVFRYTRIGVTAGASTPDYIVDEVEQRLAKDEGAP